jgi:hypothetical protein
VCEQWLLTTPKDQRSKVEWGLDVVNEGSLSAWARRLVSIAWLSCYVSPAIRSIVIKGEREKATTCYLIASFYLVDRGLRHRLRSSLIASFDLVDRGLWNRLPGIFDRPGGVPQRLRRLR